MIYFHCSVSKRLNQVFFSFFLPVFPFSCNSLIFIANYSPLSGWWCVLFFQRAGRKMFRPYAHAGSGSAMFRLIPVPGLSVRCFALTYAQGLSERSFPPLPHIYLRYVAAWCVFYYIENTIISVPKISIKIIPCKINMLVNAGLCLFFSVCASYTKPATIFSVAQRSFVKKR